MKGIHTGDQTRSSPSEAKVGVSSIHGGICHPGLVKKIPRTMRQFRTPVLHRPQKNVISPIFCTDPRLEAPLPVYFSCTTFRRSATTSATLLIPKCTTRRWNLRCSYYRVAKRQQFSCDLSTATLSLKFEDVVPEGWIRFFPCYIYVIFLLLYEHVRVRVMAFSFFSGL